jgi:hypothetical protein
VAIIHRAQIQPSKIELIGSWLPGQQWFDGRSIDGLASLGAYRFDDPAGDVGVETLLIDVAGQVVQVPMTYRGAPLAGAEPSLMGTLEHSVLGTRWVYDACADPVYANELAAAILAGGRQVDEFVEGDGGPTFRASTVAVQGSGSPDADVATVAAVDDLTVATTGTASTITTHAWELTVARVVDVSGDQPPVDDELVGSWSGQPHLVRLASARRR